MAIDSIPFREADNLADSTPAAFYPLRIPVSHWQLRHYISTPEPGLIYYASGHDIFCLHTASRKRRLIATLPFEARCTATGYGWICVGGEHKGHFAAIKLDSWTTAVDDALSLGGNPWSSNESDHRPGFFGRRVTDVEVEQIGEHIVNSISIHHIHDEAANLDDIVAVLTNNDQTVRIYSLPCHMETTVLDLVFPINHATLSPDGSLLVAVGDSNQAFFFQRELHDTPPQIAKPHNRLTSDCIDWKLCSVVDLHISEAACTTGYFTTTWSPSGRLCAVGSEGGYITVFDVDTLRRPELAGEDAVVAVMPGSRPDFIRPHPGAIRSMMFAPDPWDLLIWAEDQGRVCIGDLRTGLRSRQIINLEPRDENLRRMTCEDVATDNPDISMARQMDELEADFMRRYRDTSNNAAAVNYATEYIEARRRQRQQRQDLAGLRMQMAQLEQLTGSVFNDPQGLTPREEQILDSLRTTRQREEARVHGGLPPSVNYTTSDMFRSTDGPSSDFSSRPRSPMDISRRAEDFAFPELARVSATSPRPMSSHGGGSAGPFALPPDGLRTGIGGPPRASSGLTRLSDGSRLPRRRASVVANPYTINQNLTVGEDAQAHTTSVHDEETPWRVIEEHMALPRGVLVGDHRPAREHSINEGATGRPNNTSMSSSTTPGTVSVSTSALTGSRLHPAEVDRHNLNLTQSLLLARQHQRLSILRAAEGESANISPRTFNNESVQAEVPRMPISSSRGITRSYGGNGAGSSSFERRYESLALAGNTISRGSTIITTSAPSGRELGVLTAGLAMSPDGRTLWAACEEGIFEIKMNLSGRLFWPSVQVR